MSSGGQEAAVQTPPKEPLWTRAFVVINLISFLSNCNMSVFFQFHSYLGSLGVPAAWQGPLISALTLVGLLVRPALSPVITAANARHWIFWGCLGSAIMLLFYNLASTPWPLLAVRCLHGFAYVTMITGLTAATVGVIPPTRSGEAFGVVGIVMVLPFALVPPLADFLSNRLGGFLPVLNLTALVLGLSLPLLLLLPARLGGEASGRRVPGLVQMRQSLRFPPLFWLLAASLLVFTAFGPVFFYVETYANGLGMENVGWFFTINTVCELGVRVLFGRAFDRYPKRRLLAAALVILAGAYVVLAAARGVPWLWLAALGLGLGWGAAMPLMNALMFDISPPAMRSLNTNLSMIMFQAGLFLGPLGAGWVVSAWPYGSLFLLCAVLCLCALAIVPLTSLPAPAPDPSGKKEEPA
jgi:predicted MFS family arabinose efflux permease